ncbi:MAG: N-6 DNA methylase [Spirochaetales bacterium]|nr:N-6 DNA methylase [Spirochaetales bacterium]
MSDLTYSEAAEFLNVSPATIRNWARQGVLSSISGSLISRNSARSFKNEMAKGKSNRLTSRANKYSAHRTFIPGEYVPPEVDKSSLSAISHISELRESDPATVLFSFFQNRTENLKSGNLQRIRNEMEIWHNELGFPDTEIIREKISRLSLPEMPDTAGLLYQILQKEGRKSKEGSYYTPPPMAEEILRFYSGEWSTFLDPCCGSGIFLLSAARITGSPLHISGWDTDETAVHIARLNLMLLFPEMDFEPDITVRNPLIETSSRGFFDLIASNPPWGHHFSRKELEILRKKYPEIRSGESFSYFLQASLPLLNEKGTLSFLLPQAFLNVNTHRDIRAELLKEYSIPYVVYYGKVFSKVQTPVIRLDLQKKRGKVMTTVLKDNRIFSADSARFSLNPFCIYDLNMTARDTDIFERIFNRPHGNLKENAEWTLGVVSGNNSRFITPLPAENTYPIVSGQDIEPFRIRKPEKYLYYERERLQQCAPLNQYRRKPKIVYRFITGKPVFALDRRGFVTLNSANSFYSEDETEPEVLVALFNSSLYRFILKKKFNSIKVLRSHLEYLPLPHLSEAERTPLKELALEAESGKKLSESLLEAIDVKVFDLYNIKHSDRTYIRKFVQ